MADFNSLEIGKRALLAQQLGLDVTSNNIANVNTPGYARQAPVFSEADPLKSGNNFLGTGVIVDKLKSFREDFFDKGIRSNISANQGYTTDSNILQQVQSIINEPSDNGLNETVSAFFNSFQTLAGNPSDSGLRDNAIQAAQTMVDRFHSVSSQLQDTRNSMLTNLKTDVSQVNSLLSDIAGLNKQIATATSQTQNTSQAFVDERANKLEELSKLVAINVTQGNNNTANVFINGINVVTGTTPSQLQLNEVVNTSTGERTAQIVKVDSKQNVLNQITPQNGDIASYLKNYNITLDDKNTNPNGYSIAQKLDEFVNGIVTQVNSLSVSGYGLDDKGATPPGISIFSPTTGNATAANIGLNTDIKADPRKLPVSDAANASGNNSIALKISGLATASNFLENLTPSGFYTSILGKIGAMANEADNGKKFYSVDSSAAIQSKESVMGVNLDEEAVNLIKFQQAFQASSRVINTTNQILSTIVNLGK